MITLDSGFTIHEHGTGYKTRTTPRGIHVIELDAWADPAKRGNKEFWENARKTQPQAKDFRREYLRDWSSPAGDAYYPEFQINGGVETYVMKEPGLLDGAIYRAWDFGIRHPACLWAQYDKPRNLLWVLRELMPGWMGMTGQSEYGIDVRSFRDTVMYLSGQILLEMLGPNALNLVQDIMNESAYPQPPWFPTKQALPLQFVDFAGPEIDYASDIPSEDTLARTRSQVLAEAGIEINLSSNSFEASDDSIRELLKIKECGYGHGSGCQGHPSILYSPFCPILIKGMSGGISYPKPTTQNPLPVKPAKEGFFEHLHDCERYLATGLFPPSKGRPQAALPEMFRGRRRLTAEEAQEQQEGSGWSSWIAGFHR